ncbi:hypothetical protein GCM10017778_32190 [Streptomyces vinaceus]|nr:hypothetical protein GCM10017778_32190 [Streptomyces vinaceus]
MLRNGEYATRPLKPSETHVGNRQADIDFTFQHPTPVRALLEALTPAGWAAEENLGCISYMINDADDMHEWYDSTPDRLDAVLTELDSTANLPYTVALNIYHPQGGTGGMLMFSAQRREVSFLPTIAHRRLPDAPQFTDLAWYLHALVPSLLWAGLEGYEAREDPND